MEFQYLCSLLLASSDVPEKARMLGSVVRVGPGPWAKVRLLLRARSAGPSLPLLPASHPELYQLLVFKAGT